jgi:hypothetical protein
MRQQVIDHLEKVLQLRAAQNRYFKSRSREDLMAAKRLETEVDTETPKLLQLLKPKES